MCHDQSDLFEKYMVGLTFKINQRNFSYEQNKGINIILLFQYKQKKLLINFTIHSLKVLIKLGIGGNLFNLIRCIYKKLGEMLKRCLYHGWYTVVLRS